MSIVQGSCQNNVTVDMFRVICSIRSTGEIDLQLQFGSVSEVRVSAGITFRFQVKCGGQQ